jgi:hypothetical protein
MTLKEKFETKSSIDTTKEAKVFAKECEKIADEFAIGFANWINEKYWSDDRYDVYYETINKLRDGIFYNSKELLEIYKKENKL